MLSPRKNTVVFPDRTRSAALAITACCPSLISPASPIKITRCETPSWLSCAYPPDADSCTRQPTTADLANHLTIEPEFEDLRNSFFPSLTTDVQGAVTVKSDSFRLYVQCRIQRVGLLNLPIPIKDHQQHVNG